jgi:protein TonB
MGAVFAAHVVLALIFIYAVHTPVHRPPKQDLVVSLLLEKKPPESAPVPLAMAKHVFTPVVAPVMPVIPPVEINIQAAVVQPVNPPPPQVVKQTAPEPHESTKEVTEETDSGPTVDASAVGNAKPAYPRASRALGEQGKVMLDVYVLADGSVGDIRVHQSSGFERLDDSALRAVRQWRFKPARQSGKQISMWYVQPITFDLRNA